MELVQHLPGPARDNPATEALRMLSRAAFRTSWAAESKSRHGIVTLSSHPRGQQDLNGLSRSIRSLWSARCWTGCSPETFTAFKRCEPVRRRSGDDVRRLALGSSSAELREHLLDRVPDVRLVMTECPEVCLQRVPRNPKFFVGELDCVHGSNVGRMIRPHSPCPSIIARRRTDADVSASHCLEQVQGAHPSMPFAGRSWMAACRTRGTSGSRGTPRTRGSTTQVRGVERRG